MSGTALHFLHGGIYTFLSSLWPFLACGAVLLCLAIGLFMLNRKKIRNKKKKKLSLAAPNFETASPDTATQSILESLRPQDGHSRLLLLAAGRINDLPVTIPINLAIHLSVRGSCLLIDLDSKRDALAQVFDVDSSRFDAGLRATPIQTSFENLSIWPARYFDLLKHTNLQFLLNAAAKKYDHTVLYAPYLTALADRKQIAYCSKQAVVFSKHSEQQEKDHLRLLLKVCNCKILREM